MNRDTYKLGIDIGSTTVKVAVLDPDESAGLFGLPAGILPIFRRLSVRFFPKLTK